MTKQNEKPTYAQAVEAFTVEKAFSVLSRPPEQGLNAAVECCDRYCGAGRVALYWASQSGERESFTFEELRAASGRFANLLRSFGVSAGDRVAGLLPRRPELLTTILGTWRIGAVYQPLFTAFGPKAIEHRLAGSGARVVVTDQANRPKLQGLDDSVRIVTLADHGDALPPGDLGFHALLAAQPEAFEPVVREARDPFLIMFTSGTTGPAKPLLVPLAAIPAFVGYLRDAVGLTPADRYWNIADPGWAYGLYYALTGPLAMGHATLLYDGPFSVTSTVELIKEYGITNLCGAPTAYRMMMAAGPEAVAPIRGQLRAVSSAGEPLNAEVIRWFAEHLDTTILDHYGQTELGMVLCNHHALGHPVRPGAAGYPVPGHRVVVVGDDGSELPAGQPGILAVDRLHSPLFWFQGYANRDTSAAQDERYYLSGDTFIQNPDGTLGFVGRADDVITSAGYRIGPFDVESALIEHPSVVEAAVIGKPDAQRTEIVKAFVVLVPGCAPTEALAAELQVHVRERLSAHAYPREVEFVAELPKTPSGKIQRFVLRERERSKAAGAESA